jgi:hypothetical protein
MPLFYASNYIFFSYNSFAMQHVKMDCIPCSFEFISYGTTFFSHNKNNINRLISRRNHQPNMSLNCSLSTKNYIFKNIIYLYIYNFFYKIFFLLNENPIYDPNSSVKSLLCGVVDVQWRIQPKISGKAGRYIHIPNLTGNPVYRSSHVNIVGKLIPILKQPSRPLWE